MMMRLAIVLALAAFGCQAAAQCTSWGKPGQVVHADDFGGKLDRWVPEYRARPGSSIGAVGGQLAIDVAGGATLWFKPKLSGNVLISYDRTVVVAGGPNDRLSDLNQFWMASDPRNANLFTRDGTFEQYDALKMYYAGIGGNTNTTTRLRKYAGGERVLLADLGDPQHLLAPNRRYAVQVAVFEGCTRVLVDGKVYFSHFDPSPLRDGWFGFRTTHSHQLIDNFTVRRLDPE
jgi:rhamnogalacturonan endolyase